MRNKDPLTAGAALMADVLKVKPWLWLSLIAAVGAFVLVFQGTQTLGRAASTPTAPPAASFVALPAEAWACAREAGGRMAFTGRVKNLHPDATLLMVKLRASLYDQADHFVDMNTGFIDAESLAPGATSAFTLHVNDPTAVGVHCKLRIDEAVFR